MMPTHATPRRTPIKSFALLMAPAALLAAPLFAAPACVQGTGSSSTPVMTTRFADNFDRESIGSDWNVTNGTWSIREGHLRVQGARNHPIWLKKKLPRNVRVEFDAWSAADEGDIKCEIFGDGRAYATDVEYTATSYVAIFGGWHNQLNVLARMEEHGSDRHERRGPRVVPNQHYHWVLERRDGHTLTWSVDGQPMLEFDDHEPLVGPGHEYFGFNDWNVELFFDNLVVTPL